MRKKRTFTISLFMMAAVLSLTACQATPKEEAIKQKGNLDEVIQDNQVTEAPEKNIEKLKDTLAAPESDKFDLKTANGKTDISVDAQVTIPEVTKVPIFKVDRYDFADKDIKPLCDIFFGSSPIYPERTYKDFSKDELLTEIAKGQKILDDADPDIKEAMEKKIKPYIDEMQALVDTAPETVTLVPISEYKFSQEDAAYGSQDFMVYGDIGGNMGHFILQKGSAYNSCSFSLDNPDGNIHYFKSDIINDGGKEAADMPNNCKYSEEEAVKLCQDLIGKLGRDKDYALYSVEPFADSLPSEGATAYSGYRIVFSRNVQGIPETADYYEYDENLGCLDTFPYNYERMEFLISDFGIENFYWESPMEAGEIQADNVKLLSYGDIINIFKNQIALKYADKEDTTAVHISQIRFGLMRVRDNDEQTTFTLVPAWDFLTDDQGLMSILTINAIDGSILNRSLGY